MDGGGPAQQARPNLQVQNLIRPEQVAKLPQLTPQQKQATEKRVSQFWEIIHANSNNQTDPKYLQASQGLAQLSSNLMQSMKAFNMQKRQQQQQQAQGAQNAQAAQNQAANQAQSQPNGGQAQNQQGNASQGFSSLLPEIQTKVRSLNFEYPPAMAKGTPAAEVWIAEAQLRYGQAIQRAQMASNKKRELQRAAGMRNQQGNPLTAEEQKGLNSKIAACDNAIKDSQNFMEKFRAQQESFKKEKAEAAQQQQQQQRMMQPGVPGQPVGGTSEGDNASNAPQMSQGMQGPQPHSIATAQAAARANSTSSNNNVPQPQPVSSTVTGAQPTPIDQAQAGFNSNSSMNQMPQPMSRPSTSTGSQSAVHPNTNMQASHAHPSSAVNPHPINNAINGMKGHPPAIPKTLSVSEPKPVPMPPSRPTLNGGANVGLPGQVAQPALTTFPGYVLEQSADGHLVSKKKLQELVREVMGPNSEETLTPEAEEVSRYVQPCITIPHERTAGSNIDSRSL